MKRILVTFAGGHLAHGICRALRASQEEFYIIGVDSSKFHVYLAEADETHVCPRGTDPNYVDVIADIANESNADFIWPMHDDEVFAIAGAVDRLPIRTWVPPLEVVARGRDKYAATKHLERSGVKVPKTFMLNDVSDLEAAFDALNGDVWLRKNVGAGGKGAFRTKSFEHARLWIDMSDDWGEFQAAEVLTGPGNYTCDQLWRDGELIASQHQERVISSGSDIATRGVPGRGVQKADAPPEVFETAVAAVKAMMPVPDGVFRIDMTPNSDGVNCVTEVDAGRFSSGGPVNWFELGYNFAYDAIRIGFGEKIDHETPVMNPYSNDQFGIGGRNRSQIFLTESEVDEKQSQFEKRLKRLEGSSNL